MINSNTYSFNKHIVYIRQYEIIIYLLYSPITA